MQPLVKRLHPDGIKRRLTNADEPSSLICYQNYFWFFLASAFFVTSNMIGVAMKIEA